MNQLPALRNDTVIARLETAYAALAEADIPTAKAIADVADAAEIYAGRRKLGEQVEQQAHAIKIEALRKLGELLKGTPKNAGARGVGKSGVPPEHPTLQELRIDKKTSSMAQKLAALPEKDFEAVRDGHEAVGKAIANASKSRSSKQEPREQPKKPDPRDAEIKRLRAALAEANEKKEAAADEARDLQDKLTAFETTEPDEQQKELMRLQKRIVRLEGEIERLTIARNDCQNKNNELIRQVKLLQRKHGN